MLDKKDFINIIAILENAIKLNISIAESNRLFGFPENYYLSIQSKVEASYLKGTLSPDEWNVYSTYLSKLDNNYFDTNRNNEINDSEIEEIQEIEDIVNKINILSTRTKNDPEKKVIFEIGGLLLRLKDLLSGNYIEFVEANLPFSQRTARNYTKTFFDLGGSYTPDKSVLKKEDVKSYLKSQEPNPFGEDPIFELLREKQTTIEDDYDARSKSWVDRDQDGNIIAYNYNILIQDDAPLRGSITPEQMEEIYRKYPYVTQSSISREFPYFTFAQFRKVLRCFNITKDKLFPPHIIEKYTEEQLAEFALKAKETAGMKRMVEKKSEYFEKRLKDTQRNLFQIQEERDWIERILNKYYDGLGEKQISTIKYNNINKNIVTQKRPRLFCFISDLHIGKSYEHPIYGRGYNKDIARERFEQIAYYICEESEKYENLTILCGGDLTESVMEDGLHAGMHKHMDLFQDEQIIYTIELFHEFFSTIFANTKFKSVELLGLEGNHDRLGKNRNEDKNRTAARVIYRVIQREWKDKVNVVLSSEGIIKEKRENICIIAHHGDSGLAKTKSEKIVNTFSVSKHDYHLIVKGHVHHLESIEGTNYITITLPSICSADTYSITEFAENSLPGFITGHQTDFGVGFDFKKITLY